MNYGQSTIKCCHGCTERQADPNCHGFCERYLKEKAELEAKNAEIRKQCKIQWGLNDARNDTYNKVTRRRHYEGKYK